MRNFTLVIFILCSNLIFGQTKWEKVELSQNKNSVELLSASENGLKLKIKIGDYKKRNIVIDGEKYFSVNVSNESLIKEKGNPELPKFTRSIMIPNNSDYKAEIVSSEYKDIVLPVAPSKGILSRSIDPKDIKRSFSEVYSTKGFFPSQRLSFGKPYSIRDTRGVALNMYPFAYNPTTKTLRVYTSIDVKISFTKSTLKKSSSVSSLKKNKYFEPLLKKHFINYKADNLKKSSYGVDEEGTMLVICHDEFIDAMKSFVNHKNGIGLQTKMVRMSEVGTSAIDVKDFIQTQYDNDKSLTFVLLVGDHQHVPTLMHYGGGSDPSFSLVSGNDNYPDIIVGRFSAENLDQVNTMVERSVYYETMKKRKWFHKGIGIASSEGTGDDNEHDYEHLRNIRKGLLGWHYNGIKEFYEGSQGNADSNGEPTVGQISYRINKGASVINYTGHGSETSWGWYAPYWLDVFSSQDVVNLKNDNKLPFVFSVACVVGNFTHQTCFAEEWLRARNNKTGRPTGAIGFYGSTINQDWEPPMQAQDKFNELLSSEEYVTFGALCYNSSWSMMDEYGSSWGSSGANMFLTWHIFGDPSVTVVPNNKHHIQPNFVKKSNYESTIAAQANSMNNRAGLINATIVNVFPNPATDGRLNVEVKGEETPTRVTLYNTMGAILYTNNAPSNTVSVDNISAKGLIIIKVDFKNSGTIIKKIIAE